MSQKNKSVLFNASAGSDVQYSGDEILIAGLDAVKLSRVINFSQINYRAEVAQVITIGSVAYTPTASTPYTVEIGDVNVRDHGYTSSLKKFSYTTPDDITTLGATAALQREAITLKLVAEINAGSPFVTAATLTLGNGFTVMVKLFEVAGEPVKQGVAFDVRIQVTTSPLFNADEVKVGESVPTFDPFTCH